MKLFQLCVGLAAVVPALASPYEQYILAPKSRTIYPFSIHSSNGSVTNPESLLTSSNGSSVFTGIAATSYDFGINIAGLVTLTIGSVDSSPGSQTNQNQTSQYNQSTQYIGVTFSESSLWVSNKSSDATADAGKDETLWFEVEGPGRYTAPREKERGAFKYMTLVTNGTGSVEVTAAEVHYTPMPHWEGDKLGNYTGYFHCDGRYIPSSFYIVIVVEDVD
jgi:hypothetical protein